MPPRVPLSFPNVNACGACFLFYFPPPTATNRVHKLSDAAFTPFNTPHAVFNYFVGRVYNMYGVRKVLRWKFSKCIFVITQTVNVLLINVMYVSVMELWQLCELIICYSVS
jgi:hypothetical protein